MNIGLYALSKGLPGVLGVLVGIVLYANSTTLPFFLMPAGVLIISIILLRIGRSLVIRYPRIALGFVEPWIASAICISALVTQCLLWVTVASPGWFELPEAELNAVKGALVGAITAFFAGAWIKEINDTKGPFLPSTQSEAFLNHFGNHHKLSGDNKYHEACYADYVRTGIRGWGLKSRWQRGSLLAEYLMEKSNPESQAR